jgi:Flp pilus assembly protein TadG
MPHEQPDDLTDEERLPFGAYDTAADLAVQCRRLREIDVSARATALETVINCLMTELWDQGFSQTEIREAFMAAVNDMNRYAAGTERR